MYYYKTSGGVLKSSKPIDGLETITEQEYFGRVDVHTKNNQPTELELAIMKCSCPLSDSEILRLDMRQRVNSLNIDNATAGRMVDCFPTRAEYCKEGELIPAGTRVRDDADSSVIWRANVDLWNTAENSPENAPTLWNKIEYHNGIRVIPDTITSTLAWKLDELGYWNGHVYKSGMDGNAYTPEQYAAGWELVK